MAALSQMDPTQALPIIKQVLKNLTSASFRRRQFMLGQRGDARRPRSSPRSRRTIRRQRSRRSDELAEASGDALRRHARGRFATEQDEGIQRSPAATPHPVAIPALGGHGCDHRPKDMPLNLRLEAVNGITSERRRATTPLICAAVCAGCNDQPAQTIVGAVSESAARRLMEDTEHREEPKRGELGS